jgi:hypothetical protein
MLASFWGPQPPTPTELQRMTVDQILDLDPNVFKAVASTMDARRVFADM